MPVPLVLLVDDTKLFLALEKEFLKQSAVRVATASNGAEALDAARVLLPDLIYMDLNMPEMGGLECVRRLKADPAVSHIPVVMVTTAGEEAEMCRRAGCSDFLTKPLNRRLFLEAGRRHLGHIDRRERRTPLQVEVAFGVSGRRATGRSVDLSRRGMYIACDICQPAEGDAVEVVFSLPDEGRIVEALGRVAWINQQATREKPALPAGFGVEFLNFTQETAVVLETYLLRCAS